MKELPTVTAPQHGQQTPRFKSRQTQWVGGQWVRCVAAALVLLVLLLPTALLMPQQMHHTGTLHHTGDARHRGVYTSRDTTDATCRRESQACQVVCSNNMDSTVDPGRAAAEYVLTEESGCIGRTTIESIKFIDSTFPDSKIGQGWLPVDKQIQQLTVSHCNFTHIEEYAFSNLQFNEDSRLTIEYFQVEILKKDTFKGIVGLRALELRNNHNLVSVEEDFLSPVAPTLLALQIESMDGLSQEMMKNMTGALTPLRKVLEIVVRENEYFTQMDPGIFGGLPLIRGLILSNNGLTTIHEDTFASVNKTIQKIDLSSNNIRSLNSGTFAGLNITSNEKYRFELYLNRNPWHCDCELVWLQEMMVETNVTFMDDPLCWTPEALRGNSLRTVAMCEDETTPPPTTTPIPTTTQTTTTTPETTQTTITTPETTQTTTTTPETTQTTPETTQTTTTTQETTQTTTTTPETTQTTTTTQETTKTTTTTPETTQITTTTPETTQTTTTTPETTQTTTTTPETTQTTPTTPETTQTTSETTQTTTTTPETTQTTTTTPETTQTTTTTPETTQPTTTIEETTIETSSTNTISPTTPPTNDSIIVYCTEFGRNQLINKKTIILEHTETTITFEVRSGRRRLLSSMTFTKTDFDVKECENGSVVVNVAGKIKGTLLRISNDNDKNYSCFTNVSGKVNFEGLVPESTHLFCLMTGDNQTVSPYNCKSLTMFPLPHKRTWLVVEDKVSAVSIAVGVVVLCSILCSVIVFVVVRQHPNLLKGSKRVVVVKHRAADVMVLPKKLKHPKEHLITNHRAKKEQIFGMDNSCSHLNYVRSISESTLATGRSSETSYVSAVQPTTAQLMQWRLEQMRARFRGLLGSDDDSGLGSDIPPPLPPYPYERNSTTSYVNPHTGRISYTTVA